MIRVIEQIKSLLVELHGCESWQEFVDSQEIGNCQFIASAIADDFPQATRVFGEIEVDYPSTDEDGEENYRFAHHWIEVEGQILDFSKGTLKDYIDWEDLYSVEPNEEIQRYHDLFDNGGEL